MQHVVKVQLLKDADHTPGIGFVARSNICGVMIEDDDPHNFIVVAAFKASMFGCDSGYSFDINCSADLQSFLDEGFGS